MKTEAEQARILLVEDHRIVARGLRSLLLSQAPAGSQDIRLSFSAHEAVREAEVFHPNIVLMDLHLPDGSGTEATRQIKELVPEARVVILTASDDPADAARAIQAGASGYLSKTMDLDELAAAVLAILSGSIVVPQGTLSVKTG